MREHPQRAFECWKCLILWPWWLYHVVICQGAYVYALFCMINSQVRQKPELIARRTWKSWRFCVWTEGELINKGIYRREIAFCWKGEKKRKIFTCMNWGWEGQKDAPSLQSYLYNSCAKFLRMRKLNSWQRSLGRYKMYSKVTIIKNVVYFKNLLRQ